jgi:hypothetical protein
MTSTWNLVSEGDGKYRLESEWGELVGWIHGHAVGLNGFRSVAASMAAVPILVQALGAILEGEYPGRRRAEVDYDTMRLVHDGAYEWIAAGAVPLARLHRPRGGAQPNECFSVELVLPSYATEATVITAALAIADRREELLCGPPRSGGLTAAWAPAAFVA